MRRKISNVLAAACTAVTMTACENATAPDLVANETAYIGTLTGYVTSWLDLDDELGADVTQSGGSEGYEIRVVDGHHQLRCLAVLQYAYVSVSFANTGGQQYRYRIDCQHDQGTGS